MGTSERQLLLAWFAWLCKWLLVHVCGGGRFTVSFGWLLALLLDGLLAERVSGDLADSTRRLVRDTALLFLLSKLTWHLRLDVLSVVTRRIGIAGSRNRAASVLTLVIQNPLGAVMVDATELAPFWHHADGVSAPLFHPW